ncbi:MAG TPA: protein kinase [Polyangiaceae bacterium]|jgi:serine/threonine-protein kinase|nr:protein kinase [Polyangiaceae bacterium]
MERDEPSAILVESLTPISATDRFGKYRSLGRIGHGGMADVFLAVGRGPAGFNKLVVLKRLHDAAASDEMYREMFLDEARLAARLNHPNVVQTYEVFEHEGAYFITMEYLEGQPLSRIARECGRRGIRLRHPIYARIVSDVLCGLHNAHDACDYDGTPLHIVHRDVSPQNVFVTYNGQVKVVDFGIAKAERSNTKTQAGVFKGKAAYMAPEQLEGGDIDRRVDIFTTGIVLWELLVGRRLMAAESTAKTLVRLLQEKVPRVAEVVPDIDPRLDRIVARALERDPEARYQTAGQMREALEQYLLDGHHIVRHEEIGRVVSDAFRDVREELARQIHAQMARSSGFPGTTSGTMPVASLGLAPPPLPRSLHPGSTSGIPASSSAELLSAIPATTTLAVAERAGVGWWLRVVLVACVASISVAALFSLIARMRMQPMAAPMTAAAPPEVPRLSPVAPTAPGTEESTPPEPPRATTASPLYFGAPPAAAAHTTQAPLVWRPARPAPVESKPAGPTTRAATAVPSLALSGQPANASLPSTPTEFNAARATIGPSPTQAAPSASTPAPVPQEGRRFRTSL